MRQHIFSAVPYLCAASGSLSNLDRKRQLTMPNPVSEFVLVDDEQHLGNPLEVFLLDVFSLSVEHFVKGLLSFASVVTALSQVPIKIIWSTNIGFDMVA